MLLTVCVVCVTSQVISRFIKKVNIVPAQQLFLSGAFHVNVLLWRLANT